MHQYNYKYVKNVFLGWGGGSEEKEGMEEVNEKVNYRDALYLNNHHIILWQDGRWKKNKWSSRSNRRVFFGPTDQPTNRPINGGTKVTSQQIKTKELDTGNHKFIVIYLSYIQIKVKLLEVQLSNDPVCLLVGWSVCHNNLKGWTVTLPCSYQTLEHLFTTCSCWCLHLEEITRSELLNKI